MSLPPSDDDRVWRALADVHRRRMLDLLRRRAMTTGELAERFPFTRFATMKHLQVLVHAGLVVVERRGRERWNHLNTVPLQRIHRRWIRPFEQRAADRMLQLEETIEREERHERDSDRARRRGRPAPGSARRRAR